MKFTLPLVAAISGLAAASPLGVQVADDVPPVGSITISQAQTSGNGCPQGTVSTSISSDRTVVTFGFDAFQAYIGPKTKPADRSKNCQIHLDLRYPGGFQYSVVKAVYHGYARLDPGVTATFYSSYFFSQNAGDTRTVTTKVSGNEFKDGAVYTKSDNLGTSSVVWSPCGANGILNANTRLALTASNSEAAGEVTTDDATVSFTQEVYVSWRKCNK